MGITGMRTLYLRLWISAMVLALVLALDIVRAHL